MDILVRDMLTLKAMVGSGKKVVLSYSRRWHWHVSCAVRASMVQAHIARYGVWLMDTVPMEHRHRGCALCGAPLISAPREE